MRPQLLDERCSVSVQAIEDPASGFTQRSVGPLLARAAARALRQWRNAAPTTPRHAREETAQLASLRQPVSGRSTGEPNRPRRSGTACPASRARTVRASTGSTSRSHARAGSSRPSSCASRARSPSGPESRLDVSTCCHVKRNRMNSAGLTGAISARNRFSVYR